MEKDDFEGRTNVEYEEMLSEMITNLWKDRIKTLAQNKVLAIKYNEILKTNKELHATIYDLQERLHHTEKDRDQLKRKTDAKKSS